MNNSVTRGASGSDISSSDILKIELDLLASFKDFCDQNGFRMWLAYGTLIGAVRHKGMIPWDDDIDVVMPNEDYFRMVDLLKEYPDSRIAPDHRFVSPSTEPLSSTIFGKLIDTRTVTAEEALDIAGIENVQGVWIDVLPLHGVHQNRFKQKFGFWVFQLLFLAMRLASWKPRRARTWWGRLAHAVLRTPARAIGPEFFGRNAERFLRSWFPRFSDSELLFSDSDMSTVLRRSYFSSTTELEFEGQQYPVPGGYREFLTDQYGDYMTPLPPEERITHQMNARWR
ncbi:MAG: LicD family protein [Actinomycetaceae bacterium]|nr:LicD family protein [Actinomycetaceae bacterium]